MSQKNKEAFRENPFETGAVNSVKFTVGAETGGTTINVAMVLKDKTKQAGRVSVRAYLSSDAAGQVIIPVAHSTSPAIGTDGLLIPVLTDKAFWIVSELTGQVDIDFVEAGALTVYLNIVLPDGTVVTSPAITHAA